MGFQNVALVVLTVPWIPEPSTVNNKLKRREGSGSTGRFFDYKPRQSQNRIE
jgi:hypothetical protein